MDLTLTTAPPEAEILTLVSIADVKAAMRIRHSREDDKIETAIYEAYNYLDGRYGWLRRSILTQTWTMTLPGFVKKKLTSDADGNPTFTWIYTNEIELPLPPLQQVTKIRYRDSDNVWQTMLDETSSPSLTTSTVNIVKTGLYGAILLADGQSWPSVYNHPEAVEITFMAGYGDIAAIKARARGLIRAIKILAAEYYQTPTDSFAEPRLVLVNRQVIAGLQHSAGQYRIPNGNL